MAAIALAIALSIAASALLFQSTGLNASALFNPDGFAGIISAITSASFIGFALLFPVSFGVVSGLSHSLEKKQLLVPAIAGTVPGIIAMLALSGFSVEKIFVAAGFAAGIIVAVQYSFVKKKEFKTLVVYRTGYASAKTGFLVFGIFLFVAVAFSLGANNEASSQDFKDAVMEMAYSPANVDAVSEQSADILLNARKQSVSEIISTPEFGALLDNNDAESKGFVQRMALMGQSLGSNETRQKLVQQIREKQNSEQLVTFDSIAERVPYLAFLANYYWLFASFAVFTTFIFFANIVAANLAALYALATEFAAKKLKKSA